MTQHFIKTDSILDEILAYKVEILKAKKATMSETTIRDLATHVPPPHDFLSALQRETVALIAEVKKASPSKGVLIENFDPVKLAKTYTANGAACISVLTDEQYFQGHLAYLEEINQAVQIPTLRKDFIIDPFQVYEACLAHASAVLLIVAALADNQLKDLHDLITQFNMTPLIEVHNEAEMERALKTDAKLIGINNRDLKTFHTDLAVTEGLAKLVPDDVTLIAESGMKSAKDVARMGKMGVHAVLIGEGLVTAPDIAAAVKAFSSQKRG
ncbi:MAG: indole-3-glycerol phosphate synthase TrpC [Anaerolineae bacterium]|nr:indole-3-glycerol phosphate synthase TrpC [Anaerolineae bacterium]